MGFLALGLVSLSALLLVASLAARLSARHLRLLALVTLFIILGTGLVVLALAGRYGLAMTIAEARDVLGVDATASREEIETAYRDLIVKNHPDHGGTDWIAAQLNQARDILLNDH